MAETENPTSAIPPKWLQAEVSPAHVARAALAKISIYVNRICASARSHNLEIKSLHTT